MGFVGFILVCWVHWGAPWGSYGLSGVAGFIEVRPGGRRVHPGSLKTSGSMDS